MLLTISLLCSGREKTTEKCLMSIHDIADKIGDSEIIVVDTGCDDTTLSLITKYADQIIPFTWCNDFAAARNVGIDAASGEWFMFIDDDEWFEDPSPIIDFFKSNIYQNYTSATYNVRNYKDLNGYAFTDSINRRIFKLENKKINRFTGRIHEYVPYVGNSEYNINCHAEHYGYAYSNDIQRIEHCKRNIVLLQQMIEEEPDSLRWPSLLVTEYYTAREYTSLNELCTSIIDKVKYYDNCEANLYRPLFYCANIYSLYYKCDYETAHILCHEYISDTRISNIALLRLLEVYIRMCYFSDKNWNEILNLSNQFDELYLQSNKTQELLNNSISMIKEAYDATYVNEVYIYSTIAAIYSNMPEIALNNYNKIIWSDGDKAIFISPDIIDIIDAISTVSISPPLQKIIEKLVNLNISRSLSESRITSIISVDTDAKKKFAKYATGINSESICIKMLRVINAFTTEDFSNITYLLSDYFSANKDFFSDSEIWDNIIKTNIDFISVLSQIPFDTFTTAASNYVVSISLNDIFLSLDRFDTCFSIDDRRYDFLQLKLYEGIMLKTPADTWQSFDDLVEAISLWTQVSIGYYSNFIRPEAMILSCPLVNDIAAISFEMNRFLELATINFRDAFATIKACIGICPPLDNTLVRLTKLYADFYKNALN